MGNFVEEQKDVQLNQRIDTMESTVNKRIYWFQNEITKKVDNL